MTTPRAVVFAAVTVLSSNPSGAQTTSPPATVTRTVQAVGYEVGAGSTTVEMVGLPSRMPSAKGTAEVRAIQGVTNVSVSLKGVAQPSWFGAEFLTYVLWAVSPEGRTVNLGELAASLPGKAELKATTQLQTFSLFVTAEPYFSVRTPGEIVVLENRPTENTRGKVIEVKDYKLLRRTQYEHLANPLSLTPDLQAVPLDVFQARNAVSVARASQAEKYAPEIFARAQSSLQVAEDFLARRADRKQTISAARQAVQSAEDSRALAEQRQDEERVAAERAAAATRARADAEAKAAADAVEARRRADELARQQAELAAAREALLKREAEISSAREGAARTDATNLRRGVDAARAQLLAQFNRILATKDTPRGLVINMADVLFDVGKFNLRPATREKLARLAGVISVYPGLFLDIEGHTDNTGSNAVNRDLSKRRAESVRVYLIDQGLPSRNITATGLGEAGPVASNASVAGRKQNRRVEIIVSGELIGTKIGR